MTLKDLIASSSCEKFGIFGSGYRCTFDKATDKVDEIDPDLLTLRVIDCFPDGDALIVKVA